jgi:hypothetical protein
LYQSCEGQAEKTPLYKLLDKISSDVAFDIISKTKEYQQSEWD